MPAGYQSFSTIYLHLTNLVYIFVNEFTKRNIMAKYNKVNFGKQDKAKLQELAGLLVVKGWTVPSGKPTARGYTPFECVNSVSPNSLGTVAASLKLQVGETKNVGTNKFMSDIGVVAETNKLNTIIDFVEHAQAYQIYKKQQAELRKELKANYDALDAEIKADEAANKSVAEKKADLAKLQAQLEEV